MDMEHRITVVEQSCKENEHHLNELEKRQNDLDELVGTVKVLAVREENVENNVKEIKADVKSLTGKPGRRWENLVTQIITILVAAVAGFVLAKIGL